MGRWTFGQKLSAAFASVVLLTVIMGAVAWSALTSVVAAKDRVIEGRAQSLIEAQTLLVMRERRSSNLRAFLLTGDAQFVTQLEDASQTISRSLSRLGASEGGEGRLLIDAIEKAAAAHQKAGEAAIALRRSDADLKTVVANFEDRAAPRAEDLAAAVTAFVTYERKELDREVQAATDLADRSVSTVILLGALAVLLAVSGALLLGSSLNRQIGSSVQQVRSSSAELQSAASQQASGSREQATAMSEIATTIAELLTTSRQIAESAQRVAKVASDTAGAARAGDTTVRSTEQAVAQIKRQVDAIVEHMLELGRKSQQIGAIVEIITELGEQTNILAINATIEAAGAGEAGRRFAVVGDEIRKLADRAVGSTKEIRALVEEIRSAVNTTVMATETGSKAVEAGARSFVQLAAAFERIGDLVDTTTDASNEIGLSTKQQTSAVEQVNLAISNVAQATRETEASSSQTLQTASQLAALSNELARLVRAEDR